MNVKNVYKSEGVSLGGNIILICALYRCVYKVPLQGSSLLSITSPGLRLGLLIMSLLRGYNKLMTILQ
jgi:hypothetical protein